MSPLFPKHEVSDRESLFSMASIGRPAATVPARGIPSGGAEVISGLSSVKLLSSFCAPEVGFKERALPGQLHRSFFLCSSAICSNAVLRLMPN